MERWSDLNVYERVSGFSGSSSAVVDEARWSRFWSWRRVIEWERQMTYEQRYEQLAEMGKENEAEIITLREEHPNWGVYRMKNMYKVSGGLSAIHRVIKQVGMVKRKKRRWRKRKDLSELKKKMWLFDKSQMDVKDLSDIYQYWP